MRDFKRRLALLTIIAGSLTPHLDAAETRFQGGRESAAKQKEPPQSNQGLDIVSTGSGPVIRYMVAHAHGMSACYGYLYISRTEIWYEVAGDKDTDHAFRRNREDLEQAKVWNDVAIELKFRGGPTYHMARMKPDVWAEHPRLPSKKSVLPVEDLLVAIRSFDAALVVAEQVAGTPVLSDATRSKPSDSACMERVLQQWQHGDAEREQIRRKLALLGFDRTIVEWLPDQTKSDSSAMQLEAVTSLDGLDKLIAEVEPGDAASLNEINAAAEMLYDPVMRNWTRQQAGAFAKMSPADLRSVTIDARRLRDLATQAAEFRRQLAGQAPCAAD